MKDGIKIFNSGNSDKWQTYEIFTDENGIRQIWLKDYWYDTGDDEPEHWRCVSESVQFTLEEWVGFIRDGIDPQMTDRYYNRPLDYIEDLTEEDAMSFFVAAYDYTPKLDMEFVTQFTPDGDYIGRYEGMRKE